MAKTKYIYGKSPNPRTWHEAAESLKTIKPKRKSGIMEELVKHLKEHKGGKTT